MNAITFTLQNRFTAEGDYSKVDIECFDHCIREGLEGIKQAVISCEGPYTLGVTKDHTVIHLNRHSWIGCFEDPGDDEMEFNGLVRGIEATINNYAMPHIKTQE